MESLLNEEFGAVKAKHSSEEALQRWRYLCGVVKNPKRRFRFTANLSTRSAMRRHNQEELRVAVLVSESALQFTQGMRPSDYTTPDEDQATGFQICSEELESSPRERKFHEVIYTYTYVYIWMIYMISYIYEKLRVAVLVSKSALQFMHGMRPRDYTGPEEVEATGIQICAEELVVENVSREVKSDYTGPEEVEATVFQICAEELVVENVSREVKSNSNGTEEVEATVFQICAEQLVVENAYWEVKSDSTGPEEVETTGSQICAEDMVLLPRIEVVEDVSPEVKSVYTCFGRKSDYIVPEEVEASGFQICSKLLVSSRKKCKFLEEVKKVSLEVKFCCCALFEDLGCCCRVSRNNVTRKKLSSGMVSHKKPSMAL